MGWIFIRQGTGVSLPARKGMVLYETYPCNREQ